MPGLRAFVAAVLGGIGSIPGAFVGSLIMGQAEISPQTLPHFLFSMRTGLVVYAIFSCLGVILSFSRGRRSDV